MTALGSLVVSLEANVAKFNSDMGKAAYQTEKAMKQISDQAKMVGTALGVMAVAGAGAMAVMAKRAIDSADSLAKMSQKTGLAVEQLSQLQYAAGLSGISNEDLEKSIRLLNISIAEGIAGDKLRIATFKSLGITTADLGKGTQEVMMKMADAYSTTKNGARKVAAGNVLMGKSSTDMIPLLNGGRVAIMDLMTEADKLGLTISTDFAKSAEEFNDNLSRIETLSSRVGISLGGDLVNGFGKVMKAMADAALEGGKLKIIRAGIDEIGNVAFDWSGNAQRKTIANLKDDLKELRDEQNSLTVDIFGKKGQIQADIDTKTESLNAAIKAYYGIKEGNSGRGTVNPPSVEPPIKPKPDYKPDSNADFKRYMDNLQGQIDKMMELSTVEKMLLDIRRGSLTVTPAQQHQLTDLAKIIDKEKELVDIMTLKRDAAIAAGDAVNMANQEYQSQLSRLLDATPSANLEKQRRDVKLLTDEFEAGRLSESLYLEAVSTRLDITSEKIEKSKSAAEELGLTFSSAFEDAIVGGKEFSDVLDGLIQDIARMAIRKSVTEPMAAYITAGMSSFLSFDGGGYTGGGPRSGGLDGKGGFLSMMHPQESIIDHSKGQSAGQALTIQINATVGDVASKSDVVAGMRATANNIAAQIARSQRYGGVMA